MITLPELPYEVGALEPVFSEELVDLHYNHHHAMYVKNLNKLIKHTEYENTSLENIIRFAGNGAIFDNASQIWNHQFYWESMISKDKSNFEEESLIGKSITKQFGNIEKFKDKFSKAARELFGSGWVWLVDSNRELLIYTLENGENITRETKATPLLTIDVWEHAYLYQKQYFANRAAYVDAWWNVVNWNKVNERLGVVVPSGIA